MKWTLAVAVAVVAGQAAVSEAQVSFRKDVAPVLVKRCLACHGEQKFKGEYQLHTLEALLKPGESGEAPVVPGKPADSYLLTLLREDDPDVRMPKGAGKLADREIELVGNWIAQGARYDGPAPQTAIVNVAQWVHPNPPQDYSLPFPVTAVAFHPDGAQLAVSGHHEILVYSATDGGLLQRLKGIAERTYAIAYNEDGSQIAVACGTPGQLGEVKLLAAADGAILTHFGSMADCALGVAFSPDGKRLAACGADHSVRVYDVSGGKEELLLKDHSDWVMSVAWSPDGLHLATASRDKTCKVFDASSGQLVTTFTEHGDCVHAIAYHSDGKHAISAGADNRIRYWVAGDPGWEDPEKMNKKKRHQIAEIGGFNGPVHRLATGGGQLFACSADKSVRHFDLEKRNQLRSFAGHAEWLYAIACHAPTQRLATAGLDGQIRIWRTDAKDEKETTLTVFIAAPGYQAAKVNATTNK